MAAGVGTAVAASALARRHSRSRAPAAPGTGSGAQANPAVTATAGDAGAAGAAAAAGWAEVEVPATGYVPAVDPLAAPAGSAEEAQVGEPRVVPTTLATAIEAAGAAADALRATADAVQQGWVPPPVPVHGLPPESGEIPAITAAMAAPTDQTVTSAGPVLAPPPVASTPTPSIPTPAVNGGTAANGAGDINGVAPFVGEQRPAPPAGGRTNGTSRSGSGPMVLPVPPVGDDDGSDSNVRNTVLAAVAMLVAVVLIGVAFVLLSGDGDSDDDTARTDDTDQAAEPEPGTTTVPITQMAPDQAFAQAAQRLETAGTFAYHGTSSATDVSNVRPGPWLGVNLTIDGQVQLGTSRFLERGTADDGMIVDTATDGVTIWGRTGASVDEMAELPLETVYELPEPTPAKVGALLLPDWLGAATLATDGGTDAQGRRVFQATLPADVLGPLVDDEAPVNATMKLSLDEAGDPAHVEIRTVGGPPFVLNVNLLRLGEDMPIQVPSDAAGAGTGSGTDGSTDGSTTPGSTP